MAYHRSFAVEAVIHRILLAEALILDLAYWELLVVRTMALIPLRKVPRRPSVRQIQVEADRNRQDLLEMAEDLRKVVDL